MSETTIEWTRGLEGFGDALDSAAITCARCASLESRIAELEQAMTKVRESLRCTKTAPYDYDADHSCATCGSSSAYAKDLTDEVIRP